MTYLNVRNKHFVTSSIKDVFENVEAQNIIDSIKETGFYKISNFNFLILMVVIYFLF